MATLLVVARRDGYSGMCRRRTTQSGHSPEWVLFHQSNSYCVQFYVHGNKLFKGNAQKCLRQRWHTQLRNSNGHNFASDKAKCLCEKCVSAEMSRLLCSSHSLLSDPCIGSFHFFPLFFALCRLTKMLQETDKLASFTAEPRRAQYLRNTLPWLLILHTRTHTHIRIHIVANISKPLNQFQFRVWAFMQKNCTAFEISVGPHLRQVPPSRWSEGIGESRSNAICSSHGSQWCPLSPSDLIRLLC